MALNDLFITHFEGLILKKTSFGEAHAVFNILDSRMGKIEVFSFGSDREKSKRRSILVVPNLVEGIIVRPRRENYFSIKEVSLIKSFPDISIDLKRLFYLFFLLEIVDLFIEYDVNLPFLYKNFLFVIETINKGIDFEKYVFYLIFNLFKEEGIIPDFRSDDIIKNFLIELNSNFSIGSGSKRFLIDIFSNDINFIDDKKISSSVIRNLIDLISLIVKNEKNLELNSFSIFCQ